MCEESAVPPSHSESFNNKLFRITHNSQMPASKMYILFTSNAELNLETEIA